MKMAGKIVGELSEKIPSNIFALNELIKNSYDAGSTKVEIQLKDNYFTISDDGKGIDAKGIKTLLHMANSTKKYGQRIGNRYTQGSKGLGFLSVFKFGDEVTWESSTDLHRVFTINYQSLLTCDDISTFVVDVKESERRKQGTTIKIKLRRDYNSNNLYEYLKNDRNRDKILNSFLDEDLKITLDLEGELYGSENPPLESYYESSQLFHVTYSSISKDLIFEYKADGSNKRYSEKFDIKMDRYELALRLMLFSFKSGGRKTDIENEPTKLFEKESTAKKGSITPLIYINKNFFNNLHLFNPDDTRNIRQDDTLPQMIGFIEIISDDESIQFNSDRTQFLENEVTDHIKSTLRELNIDIQKKGRDIKREIEKKENEKKQNNGKDESKEQKNSSAQAERDEKKTEIKTPKIKLDHNKPSTFNIPTTPMNLRDYIEKTNNSKGEEIENEKISIEVDGEQNTHGILASVSEACIKKIVYKFEDEIGSVQNSLELKFIIEKIKTSEIRNPLIPQIANENYSLNFTRTPIMKLVNQINSLYHEEKTDYDEVIACSLRAVFELAVYELEISKIKFSNRPKLDEKVEKIMAEIRGRKTLITEMSKNMELGYNDLNGRIISSTCDKSVNRGNLGAHKSTTGLSKNNIKEMGNDIALFITLANELLNNPNANLPSKPYIIN